MMTTGIRYMDWWGIEITEIKKENLYLNIYFNKITVALDKDQLMMLEEFVEDT